MESALKIVHFLSIWLAGGAAIGHRIMLHTAKSQGIAPTAMRFGGRIFALTGLIAILLLWASGLGMWAHFHDARSSGTWFVLKLIAATGLLLLIGYVNLVNHRATKGAPPLAPARVGQVNLSLRLMAIVAIVAAVLSFSGS